MSSKQGRGEMRTPGIFGLYRGLFALDEVEGDRRAWNACTEEIGFLYFGVGGV